LGGIASYSVAVSANTLVVGDIGSGQAYLYTKEGSSWHRVTELAQLGANNEAGFGLSVALSGNTVVIGGGGPANGPGAVYLYQP
jgi:hypothetical protein